MNSKKFTASLCLLSLYLLICHPVKPASGQEWKSFTNVGVIEDIVIGDGTVWSGSNGGVLRLQTADLEITKFTNTDGLSSNEVVAAEIDQHGTVWFALFDGLMNRFNPVSEEWEVFEDYKDRIISDITSFGDSLYVALDIGVSLFTIDKKEVKETYVNMGLSPSEVLEKIAANSVFITGEQIWVATDRGGASSSLSLSNLQAPSSWAQHTTDQGLPTNSVNRIVVLDTTPFAATRSGVSRLVDGRWEASGLGGTDVRAIEVVAANGVFATSTVVALTSGGVFWLDPSATWRRLGPGLSDVTALNTDGAGNVWIGRRNKGLASFDLDENNWTLFEINSPGSNDFRSLALDSKDRLWCASQFGGVHILEGDTWTNFSRQDGLSSNDFRTVLVDSEDRIWFGSWGGGITMVEETVEGFSFTQIDTSDGVLAAFDDRNFVVINHLTQDPLGNIWILNREASNTQVLLARTPEDQYAYFSSSEGLFTPFVLTAEVDGSGRVWVGTEDRGIKVLNYRGTLFDKNDDDFSQGLVSAEGLFSNKITALAEDRDGVMWIGSDEGVNFWFQERVGNQFGLINNSVNAIGVDATNNKWFGTANGVSVLSADGISWTHYTTGNSQIVSKTAQSFAFNENTGEVWIGTTNGLSRLQTNFTAPSQNLSLLTGFPNPFVIDGTSRFFTISNLAENTNLVIYNAHGAKIRSITASAIQGAQYFWDGRDVDGNFVPSGIYVYLGFTESGFSATGKVAVIRR